MPNTQNIGPGFYKLDDDVYHADPCPAPSLSNSIAKPLIEQSPRHAWTQHPRLNPDYEREDKSAFDMGSAFHDLVLRGLDNVAIVEANDWRTKAAREARDAARTAGRLPLLAKDHEALMAMHDALRRQLHAHECSEAFTNGKPEMAIVWQEGDIWCRSRLDWLPDDPTGIFYDLKTTGNSASPDAWGRRVFFDTGCDMQAAFYRRGIRKTLGIADPVFRFVVIETKPPHALCVIEPDPAVLAIADKKVQAAIDLWAHCTRTGDWPGYPARVCYVDLPAWRETQWLEREVREGDLEGAIPDHLLHWQAPSPKGEIA